MFPHGFAAGLVCVTIWIYDLIIGALESVDSEELIQLGIHRSKFIEPGFKSARKDLFGMKTIITSASESLGVQARGISLNIQYGCIPLAQFLRKGRLW